MQRLIDGVHRFREREFGRYRDIFENLAEHGQKPHALFITCSDSRVIAELITHSSPGELFVVKNVGNIVPAPEDASEYNSTAAAIEFAVGALKVDDVVVCGHSQCGAMSALLEGMPPELEAGRAPHLERWLSLASPVRKTVETNYVHVTSGQDRATVAGEENVLFGLENLRRYPIVAERLERGDLRLHGWYFKIATAELFAFDPTVNQFVPLIERPDSAS